MYRPAGMSDFSEDESDELELESGVGESQYTSHRGRPLEEIIDMTPTLYKQEEFQEPPDSGFSNGDPTSQSIGSLTLSNESDKNGLVNEESLGKYENVVNGHGSTLSHRYHNGYMKASSPTSSCSSRKSHSPTPLGTRSWRQMRMHEGYSLPLDEFRMAAMHGNLPLIQSFVKQGIAVDQILKSGWTCLMYACSCGKSQVVQFLLHQNADPNLHKELFTALMAACASSRESEADLLQCVELLLSHGAKVDTAERHRMTALIWTALSWAATKGHGKVVQLLLKHLADPLKMNCHGQRAADIALAAGNPEIADILERVTTGGANHLTIDSSSEKVYPKCSSDIKTTHLFGELEMVLAGLDLSYMIPLFQKHQVSFESFLRLSEKDLENMNVTAVGVRKKILHAIKEINKKEWQTSSLPNVAMNTDITVPESVAMIANINKHIRYMHASVGYLRDQLQGNPRLLQLGQEVHSVSTLASHCGDTMKYIQGFHEELKFFKNHLDKLSGNAEYSPADLIVDCADNGRVWQRRILASLVTTTAIATILWYSRPHIFESIFNIRMPQNTVTLDV
ncbi:Ankyrin repeat, SAM and basic leucine zipper domain-containing protein 1-like 1 [Homarus americanus]|uniref:Ankyrin repeat, SAM and basic leucine zipper domain-containing protein 1-like 1 n=1 Tax=Homarus americanus TaxID=6706 RepID=A0A8J5K9R3_HOMAM|nr:Ankyrin repeat, SAM and basic leucine zipper domain-containing protein 1-like 1 [Homarus americanus]